MDTEKARYGFWVWENNLIPSLLIFSHLANYSFDESDKDAIEYGISLTSDEEDFWFEYHLIGERTIELKMARDTEERDMVHIGLRFDSQIRREVEFADWMTAAFNLTAKGL